MTNLLRAMAVVLLVSCGGGGGGDVPCTATWTGAVEGSADCTSASSDALLGAKSADSLNWLVAGMKDSLEARFQYDVPNPPDDSYENSTSDTQFCSARLGPTGTDTGRQFTAYSRGTTTGPRGECRISFTNKTDTSSNTATRFTVHGSAKATLLATDDDATTVTLTVTF